MKSKLKIKLLFFMVRLLLSSKDFVPIMVAVSMVEKFNSDTVEYIVIHKKINKSVSALFVLVYRT